MRSTGFLVYVKRNAVLCRDARSKSTDFVPFDLALTAADIGDMGKAIKKTHERQGFTYLLMLL